MTKKNTVDKKIIKDFDYDLEDYFRVKIKNSTERVKFLFQVIKQRASQTRIYQKNIAEQEAAIDKLIFTRNSSRNIPCGVVRDLNILKQSLEPYKSTIKIYKDAVLKNKELTRKNKKDILSWRSHAKGCRARLKKIIKEKKRS